MFRLMMNKEANNSINNNSPVHVFGTLVKTQETYKSINAEECQFDWVVGRHDLNKLNLSQLEDSNKYVNGNMAAQHGVQRIWIPSWRFQVGKCIGSPADWCVELTSFIEDKGIPHISLYLWLLQFHDQIKIKTSQDDNKDEDFVVQFVDVIYKFEVFEENRLLMSKESSIRRFRNSEDSCIWGWIRFLPLSEISPTAPEITIRVHLLLLQKSYELDMDMGEFDIDISSDQKKPKSSHSDTSFTSSSSQKRNEPMDMEVEFLSSSKKSKSISVDSSGTDNSAKIKNWVAGLWKSKQGWDTEVKSGKKTFKTHANILCARSDFFEKEFQIQGVSGKKTFTVNDSITPLTVETLLEHCYTGQLNIDKSFESYREVYKAAFKFDMRVLKQDTFLKVTSGITSPLVATQLLLLAKEYPPELSSLKNLANYFAENFTKLQKIDAFIDFQRKEIEENGGEFFVKLIFQV